MRTSNDDQKRGTASGLLRVASKSCCRAHGVALLGALKASLEFRWGEPR